MTDIKFYQPRRVREIGSEYHINEYENDSSSLRDALEKNSKVFLLGNAGTGKSTELKVLCRDLNTKIISLRNFTIGTKIKKYLPKSISLKKKPDQILIFDGLDEVSSIENFLSHFENFLLEYDQVKVVISCRTNVYQKYGIRLKEFKTFILEPLLVEQKVAFIESKIKIEVSHLEFIQYENFLDTPFNIVQFCDYYLSKGAFPSSQSELWDLFIERELEVLSKDHLKKREESLDVYHIKDCLQEVSIINELMSSNFIEGNDLYTLLGKDDKALIEQISFIEQIPNSKRYGFRHKIYQEFFAAQYLNLLDVDKILEIITLDDVVKKTKPSLFNVISFLMNILESSKFEELKNWLLLNEPDILLLCEENRLKKETQNEIFKEFFENEVINTTLWIQRNNRFPLARLAKFADIDYLFKVIHKDSNHRITLSALEVLCISPNAGFNDSITSLLYDYILENKYQSNCFEFYVKNNFDITNRNQFYEILVHLKSSNDLGIHHDIIKALSKDINKVENFDFFTNSLDKLYLDYEEKQKDRVVRFTTYYLERILIEISDDDKFFELINILNDRDYSLKITDFNKENFLVKLIDKTVSIIKKDEKYLNVFLKITMSNLELRLTDFSSYAIEVLNLCNSNFSLVKYISYTYGINKYSSIILSELVNNESLEFLIEQFRNHPLNEEVETGVLYLRNRLFVKNRELAYLFEEKFINEGVNFISLLKTEDQYLIESNERIDSFNDLFDVNVVKGLIQNIFEKNDVIEMSFSYILEVERAWLNANPTFNQRNSIYEILFDILRERNYKVEEIVEVLDREPILLAEINERLVPHLKECDLTSYQFEFIKKECQKLIDEIEFDSISSGNDQWIITINHKYYSYLEIILDLDKKLDLCFDQDFYLKLLVNNDLYNFSDNFQFLTNMIKDRNRLNNQIVINILGEKLSSSGLKEHLEYALNKKLIQCYDAIGNYIIKNDFIGYDKDILKLYIDLIDESKVLSFLKECCEDIDSILCWNAIKMFMERGYDDHFIIKIAEKYLSDSNNVDLKFNFIGNALSVLFYSNHKDSLREYYTALKDKVDRKDDFTIDTINNLISFQEGDLEILEQLFYLIYDNAIKDHFAYHSAKSNLSILFSNFSKNQVNHLSIVTLLNQMLKRPKNTDKHIFFINNLLKGTYTGYYNSLIKKYNFTEARTLLLKEKDNIITVYQEEDMLKDILFACSKMQENKSFWGSEDERTKQILDLLSIKYTTKDQSTYGVSTGGKQAGEVDGVINNTSGSEIFIEALNLNSIDQSSLKTHIEKLEYNYDSKGLRGKFLIVYYNSKGKFEDFCSRYYSYIESQHSFNFEKNSISLEEVDYAEQYLIKTTHLRNNKEVYLYHILLNMR